MAARERPAASADPDAYGRGGRSAWMDLDWREHQRWLLVDGHPLNLVDLGPARDTGASPMLFVQRRRGSTPDALTAHDIEDRLGAIRCPTLVYWGDSDRLVPVRHAARLVAGIPGARGVILADTGHMAMLERPARFNADVDAFLAGRAVGVGAGALDADGGPTPG